MAPEDQERQRNGGKRSVIDLTLSDDDEDADVDDSRQSARKRRNQNKKTPSKNLKRVKREGKKEPAAASCVNDVEVLEGFRYAKGSKYCEEDDDIEVLEGDAIPGSVTAAAAAAAATVGTSVAAASVAAAGLKTNGDDAIEVVGTKNHVRLPHVSCLNALIHHWRLIPCVILL